MTEFTEIDGHILMERPVTDNKDASYIFSKKYGLIRKIRPDEYNNKSLKNAIWYDEAEDKAYEHCD